MSDLNEDGLIPGQPVDFATIQRVERAKSPEKQAEQAQNLQAKPEVRRGRPPISKPAN
jgi:hypothetical protein